jgi:hypothetical protein
MAMLRRLMPIGLVAGVVLLAAAAVFAAAGGSSSRGSASVAQYCKMGDSQPGAADRFERDDKGCTGGGTAGGEGEGNGNNGGSGGVHQHGGGGGGKGNAGGKHNGGGGTGGRVEHGGAGTASTHLAVGGKTLPFTGLQILLMLALAAALLSSGLLVKRAVGRRPA